MPNSIYERSKIIAMILILSLCSACTTTLTLQQAAYYNAQLSLLYTKQGAYAQARNKAFHALQLAPKSAFAHYAVAYYAQKTEQNELAKQHYQDALHISPDSGELINSYAIFLCEQGNYSQALRLFAKATQDFSYSQISDIYANAGNCALKMPNKALAMDYFTKAIQHDPKRHAFLAERLKTE